MHENGISMWFRFAVEPVEQQRPRAVHRGKGIRLYDPAKVKAYKVQLHDLASREYHGSPFKDAIKVELTFYRRIQKSISNAEYERRLKNETLPTVKPDTELY